ncbi:hypothetical protein V6N11_083264 [Hibiscus sabdariffa]|uniref:Uncharacterized protein n=1 Tax=Hibiscus sabdariffa TaxID=183260 RepID=A0ABR2QLD9_9ROSI
MEEAKFPSSTPLHSVPSPLIDVATNLFLEARSSSESAQFQQFSSFSSTPRGGQVVREAVDRALAVAATRRTRWSQEPLLILEEAINYVVALEMQVQAMSALVELLFGSTVELLQSENKRKRRR